MPTRQRKKLSRMRGSGTHSGGDKKKRRGAGHRGGRGRAGSGKRGDAKKPRYWKAGRAGPKGFISRNTVKVKAINTGDINLLVENKKIEKKIDLGSLGYTKLLSKGSLKYPIEITVDAATPKAIEKVTAAGGKVNVPE